MSRTTNILIDEKIIEGHLNSGPNMWREEYPFFRGTSHFFP